MRVFRRYFTVDKSFRSTKQILRMAKLGLYLVMGDPSVQQVRFRADYAADAALDTRLYASADQIRATLRRFLGAGPAPEPAPAPAQTRTPRKRERAKPAAAPGLVDARPQGVDQAVLAEQSCASPSSSRGCGSRRAPTPRPARARTRSATRRATAIAPTGWSSRRARTASTTASRA